MKGDERCALEVNEVTLAKTSYFVFRTNYVNLRMWS